jgi:hypothetical protein
MSSMLQTQVTLPMIEAMNRAASRYARSALSQRIHTKAGVATAKFVVDKEAMMSGRDSLAATVSAANPAMLLQMKSLYARRRENLRNFLKALPGEHRAYERRSREQIAALIQSVLSLYRSNFSAVDAGYNAQRGDQESGGSGKHPAVAALEAIPTDGLLRDTADAS